MLFIQSFIQSFGLELQGMILNIRGQDLQRSHGNINMNIASLFHAKSKSIRS